LSKHFTFYSIFTHGLLYRFQHNFEDAHFEHDRVDAVAMERLTASPHVINIFGFCGHSVLTEFADGPRVGELADKKKSTPLARLSIARDIANGLADVHGIDGDELTTFVHLDINPANVVSIGGTLKLNDFNIGILRRWNTTSNTYCGFPAQFPNPQWRSPEEARNEQHLTEKVDVFSMGHIFFRLICGHEPWNKLEEGGKPSKEAITNKVLKGVLPRIPEEILTTNDPEVIAIRDAMLACYTFEPNHRPSARSIAGRLQETLDLLEQKDDAKEH
jgi:serine/threonine protein kinase